MSPLPRAPPHTPSGPPAPRLRRRCSTCAKHKFALNVPGDVPGKEVAGEARQEPGRARPHPDRSPRPARAAGERRRGVRVARLQRAGERQRHRGGAAGAAARRAAPSGWEGSWRRSQACFPACCRPRQGSWWGGRQGPRQGPRQQLCDGAAGRLVAVAPSSRAIHLGCSCLPTYHRVLFFEMHQRVCSAFVAVCLLGTRSDPARASLACTAAAWALSRHLC